MDKPAILLRIHNTRDSFIAAAVVDSFRNIERVAEAARITGFKRIGAETVRTKKDLTSDIRGTAVGSGHFNGEQVTLSASLAPFVSSKAND